MHHDLPLRQMAAELFKEIEGFLAFEVDQAR